MRPVDRYRRLNSCFLLMASAILLCYVGRAHAQASEQEAAKHFQAAHLAQNAGNLDVAAQEYRKVIEQLPQAAEAYASLGILDSVQHKYADSVRELLTARKLKPGLRGVSLYLGMDYARMGQPHLALISFQDAARQEPTNRDVLTRYGRALWDAGKIPEALDQFRNASQILPLDPNSLMVLGEAYRRASTAAVDQIIENANGAPIVHQIYGDIYRDQQAWGKSSGHYHRALEADAHWVGAHLGLGEIALRQGHLDEAEVEFKHEIENNPKSAQAYVELGEVSILRNQASQSLAYLESAITIDPDQAIGVVGSITTLESNGLPLNAESQAALRHGLDYFSSTKEGAPRDLALALISARLRDNQKTQEAWNEYLNNVLQETYPPHTYASALQHFQHKDYSSSEIDLDIWLRSHAMDTSARYLLARTYRLLSLSVLSRLLALAPDSYSAHQLLAETYESAEDFEKGIAEYRIVEKMVPDLYGIHFSLGHLLLQVGREDDAMTEFREELQRNPDHAGANAEVGNILVGHEEQQQGISYLQKAVDLDPELWEAHRELGKAYYLQKQYPLAELELQKAIRHDPDGIAHYELGLVYRASGRAEAAKQMLIESQKIKRDKLVEGVSSREMPEAPHS